MATLPFSTQGVFVMNYGMPGQHETGVAVMADIFLAVKERKA